MGDVKVIQVIYSTKGRVGSGVKYDPVRSITEILDFNGNLICVNDPEKRYTKLDLFQFGEQVRSNIEAGSKLDIEELLTYVI